MVLGYANICRSLRTGKVACCRPRERPAPGLLLYGAPPEDILYSFLTKGRKGCPNWGKESHRPGCLLRISPPLVTISA